MRMMSSIWKVEILLIENNGITDLSNLTFKNLYYLKKLSLKDNKIKTIQEKAFYDLINLEELNLESNKMSDVSFRSFEIDTSPYTVEKMSHLKIFDYKNGNKIEYKLKLLNLNINPIKFVDQNFINSELYRNLNQIYFYNDFYKNILKRNQSSNITIFYQYNQIINEYAPKRKLTGHILYSKFSNDILPLHEHVRAVLDYPISASNNKRIGQNFRSGDIRWIDKDRTIEKIILNPDQPVMYQLNGTGKDGIDNNVAYTKQQLQVIKKDEIPINTETKCCTCRFFNDKAICKHLVAACMNDDVELYGLKAKSNQFK